jgi:hypothetical protein
MSVTLTNLGWEDSFSSLNTGDWSANADVVLNSLPSVGSLFFSEFGSPDFNAAGPAVSVADDQRIQTGAGSDTIIGATLGGVLNVIDPRFSQIVPAGNFRFSLESAGVFSIDLTAIVVAGLLTTNEGADIIFGSVIPSIIDGGTTFDFPQFGSGIYVTPTGEIGTGRGADSVIGIGFDESGIFNSNIIDTRDGNDLISGESSFSGDGLSVDGIYNDEGAVIRMATGNDTLTGNVIGLSETDAFFSLFEGGPVDIRNVGEIRMGAGADPSLPKMA